MIQERLIKISAPDFDLAMTLNSGQVFHWEKAGEGFIGTISELPVYVKQAGGSLEVCRGEAPQVRAGLAVAREARSFARIVAQYFALDHPLQEICDSFPKDAAMDAARQFCRGLRIIRQPKWECLATFICSSMKQVAHIRQISRKLRERFGQARKINGWTVSTFPSAERITNSSERELRGCALGYRAKNLLETARQVVYGAMNLEKLAELGDVDLRERLCELPGVGAKVANCVMLFAYERLRAFPIDVWIERVLRQKYFPRARKLNMARLSLFTQKYFGDHGGYAQQYLFHHARTSKIVTTSKRKSRKRGNILIRNS